MKILAIDTSCDETAAAVTESTRILSSVIWSHSSLHAKWGGVVPSLAQRMHEERIGFVVDKAIHNSRSMIQDIDAIAVTIGPGLSIALGVGVDKAKELAKKYEKSLIAVNHLEGHLLSCLAKPNTEISNSQFLISNQLSGLKFPSLGLVISGGNTILVKITKIGEYETLARTVDDALGEALDKAARMLGLGYPGGPILEKLARLGNPKKYTLPIPLAGQEKRQIFSYSGLKTAFSRLVESEKPLNKQKIYNLAACFQDRAFNHLLRVLKFIIHNSQFKIHDLYVGGGVAANVEVRKRLRQLGHRHGLRLLFPYSKKLYTDNAAMIGVAAYFKARRGEFEKDIDLVDRDPSAKI